MLLRVPWRLGTDEFSTSLWLERVERVWRSGEDLVGLWSRKRFCGGDLGEANEGRMLGGCCCGRACYSEGLSVEVASYLVVRIVDPSQLRMQSLLCSQSHALGQD